jgi:hypothetical protein
LAFAKQARIHVRYPQVVRLAKRLHKTRILNIIGVEKMIEAITA